MAAPIRVGFIGLTSTERAQYAGAWGQNAHLPYLTKSDKYTITALCNSSAESAKKAIKLYGLDATKVQAYGDPQSLADDPNVDMVVCSVNVREHYKLIKPAVLAGKKVFCEWPLASNLTQMKEIADIAEEKNALTIVGLQGRNGAYNQAIKKLLGDKQGQLGEMLSSWMTFYSGFFGMAIPQDISYLMDLTTGGNLFTITGIHVLDTMTAALGDIKSSTTLLKNRRPTLGLLDSAFKVVEPNFPNNTPEHVLVQGVLEGPLASDVPFGFLLRGGPGFTGTPAYDWRIYCQKGEIRISGDNPIWLAGGIKVQIHNHVTQKVEDVDLKQFLQENNKDDVEITLGVEAPADNVGRLYEAFADGQKDKYLDFKQSLKWAEFIQDAYNANGF